MADTPKHSVSVAGVVIGDQDRVLVIQRRDNGHWEPPGGVLELDETPEAGVRREIWEETGLSITVDRLSGVYKNISVGVVSLVFRCHTSAHSPLEATKEAAKVAWVQRDAIDQIMNVAYATRVHDAFSSDVRVRTHDGVNLLASIPFAS